MHRLASLSPERQILVISFLTSLHYLALAAPTLAYVALAF